jgi:hypothetical protein
MRSIRGELWMLSNRNTGTARLSLGFPDETSEKSGNQRTGIPEDEASWELKIQITKSVA